MGKRVFLVVLDSVGIGALPDAEAYGDAGSNTLSAAAGSSGFAMPNMERLGLFDIEGVTHLKKGNAAPIGAFGRLKEASKGKDTTIGHWEIAGIVSERPLPTFPEGFPKELLEAFSERTGRKVLCNKPYSGTDVIRDYGKEHMETGALIVYTSADSVFQIAAHEAVVPVEELYRYCEIARELCQGEYGVGRVIARPFEGEWPFTRTARRHDYSLVPPKKTMLNILAENGYDVIGVGKINDIFAGSGITEFVRSSGNEEGIEQMIAYGEKDFHGLCFVNLVDFDSKYGHRNDVEGYGKALSYFDAQLPRLLEKLREGDLLLITADHGCDPSTPSTDHSREYVPLVAVGQGIRQGADLGTRDCFADTGATVLDWLGVSGEIAGSSYLELLCAKPERF
ncbi:MAG: phosphopentomutase [Lachnospiraceae bacterium]|nr:phosphopentomutase [Lachnospiraceae bacterium]